MKVLAIRLARFGDIVLLLPALSALKANVPDCHLTFLTDHRLAPLAEMCPAIDDIIPVDRIRMRDGSRLVSLNSMWEVIRNVRRRHFDLAIDFHGFRETNLLSWLSGSTKRIGMKRFNQSFLSFCFNLPPVPEDKNIHSAEMFMKIVERFALPKHPANPPMKVPDSAQAWVRSTLNSEPYVGMYVDAPTNKRIWPPESFSSVADHLVSQHGLKVVAVSGPDGAPLLKRIQETARFKEHILAFSTLGIPQLAAVVQKAEMWISNDTGPMHLGPILGVPTLALFSIGLPEHFRPTGTSDCFLQAIPIEGITVGKVIESADKLMSRERPDLRR